MSFLFPLYLLGAAALAVPILLHLRKRPPKEHIPFSSHMFLEKTPERLTRRTRLERWLLLALRCLALLLLAFAFTRPFFRSLTLPNEVAAKTRAVILVDRSASMQREDLWQRALAEAKKYVSRYSATDEVAFGVFDEETEMLADLPAWAALGKNARISGIDDLTGEKTDALSWKGTDVGKAMTEAADLLLAADADNPAGRRELVVISDFQEGAQTDRLRSGAWPEEVEVIPVALTVKTPGNLSANLAATPPRANVEEAEVYRVRIRNSADSESANAVFSWKGFPDTAVSTTIAPGTSRILTSTPRPENATRGILAVEGDSHPFDNEIYVSPVRARPLRVHLLAGNNPVESAGSPLFYLRRALQPTPTLNPIVSVAANATEPWPEETEVIVAAGEWPTETGEKLNQFAEAGGLVIAIPSRNADPTALASVIGHEGWELGEADVEDYALLADLDFEHPVLAPFARAKIRDFTGIRFWKHRALTLPEADDESTRVLATFDGELPALVEQRTGQGTVFVFLSGGEPADSQLALSSKFVPLLFSILEHTGFSIRSAATLYVGETEHTRPGFYETGETGDGAESLVAVNLHPTEGNTNPLDPFASFREWNIPLSDENAEAEKSNLTATQLERLESEEKEKSQKLWKWLILAALILLLIETWVAGRPPAGRPSAGRSRERQDTAPNEPANA